MPSALLVRQRCYLNEMVDSMEHEDQFHFVSLRQWYLCKDEEAFRQLVKRGDHRLTDGFLPECYTDGCEYGWIQGMVDGLLWGDELHYAVDVDGKAVGCLNVSHCGGVHRRTGILRLILLPEYCGQGIGTQVIGMVIMKAFHYFREDGFIYKKGGFDRLHAHIIGHNPAAERVLEKNGFIYEGTLRSAACKDGKIYDQKVYGFLHPLVSPVSSPREETYATPTLPDNQSERIEYIHKLLRKEWT